MNERDMELVKIIAVVAAAYPTAGMSADTMGVWREMLADIEIGRLRLAVQKIIVTSKWCPSVAEVRRAALDVGCEDAESLACEAWSEVLAEISGSGIYRMPRLADPLAERALQCTVSWSGLCMATNDEMPSHRARFLEAYQSLHRKAVDGALLPDTLRLQIESARQQHAPHALDDQRPGGSAMSGQLAAARAMLAGLGSPEPEDAGLPD